MSTTEEQVWRVLRPYIVFVCTCWLLTVGIMFTAKTISDYDMQKEIERRRAEMQSRVEALVEEDFEDYMDYRRIFPPKRKVGYDVEIWSISDSAVLKVPFVIVWREKVECDNNPYDGRSIFEFYASGAVTSVDMERVRDYPEGGGKYRKGWPVREWRNPDKRYKAQSPILRYPNHDADCRVVSTMTQTHIAADGTRHRKSMTMAGEVAEVRGFN